MKKLILFVCISFIGFYLSGQELTTLSIDRIDSKSLSKGDNISVKIKLDKTSFVLSSFQLYINYDPDVLKYQETNQIHNYFSESWKDNDMDGLYAALYVDFNRTGFEVSEDIILCELEFTYQGGECDLSFGTEEVRENNVLLNGLTMFTDLPNNTVPLNLVNGCVCNLE